MGIFNRIGSLFRGGIDKYFDEYADVFRAGLWIPSKTGIKITDDVARSCAAVYSCTRILAESVAGLPLFLHERTDYGREIARDHRLYETIHDRPNIDTAKFTFFEAAMWHLIFYGNFFAVKAKLNDGTPQLHQLDSRLMSVKYNKRGQIEFIYREGTSKERVYRKDDIFHVPGISRNGITGESIISAARETVGLSVATEEYASRFYNNSGVPAGIIKDPRKRDVEAEKNLVESWNKKYGGVSNSNKVAVLWEGMEFEPIAINPEDTQMIATRKYQIKDIARIFRIPLHFLGDMEGAKYNNIEHEGINYVVYSLRPWLIRFENAINTQLLKPAERGKYYAEFKIDGLLRGDNKQRNEAYQIMHTNGVISINEWREKENMNPIKDESGNLDPAGDKYMLQNLWTELGAGPAQMMPTGGESEPEPEPEPKVYVETRSIREQRSISKMKSLRRSHEEMFEKAAREVVKREIADIGRYLDKGKPIPEVKKYIDEFYNTHGEFVMDKMGPVYRSFAGATHIEAAEMLDNPIVDENEIKKFATRYMKAYKSKHIYSSKSQLLGIVDNNTEDVVPELLRTRLDEWGEKRAGKIARREVVNSSSAVAMETYRMGGATKKIWAAVGDTCPYCLELDGVVVGIGESFIEPNGTMKAKDDKDNWMTFKNGSEPALHPQLHDGCDCVLMPG